MKIKKLDKGYAVSRTKFQPSDYKRINSNQVIIFIKDKKTFNKLVSRKKGTLNFIDFMFGVFEDKEKVVVGIRQKFEWITKNNA